MTDAFTFTPAARETLGQDGNDLLIVNNGDGSDFLETSLEAAGLEVVVAAATTENPGGDGLDTVQVNGAGWAPAEDDVWVDGVIITGETFDTSREAAGLEVVVAAATTEGEGGLGNDFVQVNGANAPDPAIGLAPLRGDGGLDHRGGYGQDALIDIGAGHWDDNFA